MVCVCERVCDTCYRVTDWLTNSSQVNYLLLLLLLLRLLLLVAVVACCWSNDALSPERKKGVTVIGTVHIQYPHLYGRPMDGWMDGWMDRSIDRFLQSIAYHP